MRQSIFLLLSAILCSCTPGHQPEQKTDTVYSVVEIHDTVYVNRVDTIYVREKPKPKRNANKAISKDKPKH